MISRPASQSGSMMCQPQKPYRMLLCRAKLVLSSATRTEFCHTCWPYYTALPLTHMLTLPYSTGHSDISFVLFFGAKRGSTVGLKLHFCWTNLRYH